MAASKTTSKKKTTTKKSTSRVGGTNLVTKHFFKGWMVAIVVLLVAVAGYAIVNFSEAGQGKVSWVSHNVKPGRNASNYGSIFGLRGVAVNSGGYAYVTKTGKTLNSSTPYACAYVYVTQPNTTVHISFLASNQTKIAINSKTASPSTVGGKYLAKPINVCTTKKDRSKYSWATNGYGRIIVSVSSSAGKGKGGAIVRDVYGKYTD